LKLSGTAPIIEATYTGPLAKRERGVVRLGSFDAFENARARSMIHHLSVTSLKVLRNIRCQTTTRPIVADEFKLTAGWRRLREELRFYLTQRMKWKRYLNKISAAHQLLRCLCFA
jgi:hypothetical protein